MAIPWQAIKIIEAVTTIPYVEMQGSRAANWYAVAF